MSFKLNGNWISDEVASTIITKEIKDNLEEREFVNLDCNSLERKSRGKDKMLLNLGLSLGKNLLSASASSVYADAVNALSPVAYYRLADTNTTAVDETSNFHLTYSGDYNQNATSLLPNESGNGAVDLYANNSGIIKGTNPTANSQGAISLILKPTGILNTNYYLFGFANNTTTSNYLAVRSESNGQIALIYSNSGTTKDMRAYTTALVQNNTYHIVIQSTGSAYEIFINNTAQSISADSGTNDGAWTSTITGLNTLAIAALTRTSDQYWYPGIFDEVAIFNTALTAQQVSDLYTATGL